MWRILRITLIVLALALLAGVVARIGPDRIGDQLALAGVGAVWLLVTYAAGTALGALPWHVILPPSHRPPVRATIASRFAASGANALFPFLGIGGEPIRLLWLRREHHPAGVAALILDRLTYGVASGVFLVIGALVAIQLAGFPADYALLAVLGALGLLVLVAIAWWVFARGRVATRVHRFVRRLRKLSHGDPDTALFGEGIDRELASMLRRRGDLAFATTGGLAARIVLGAEIYVGFAVLGEPLSLSHAIVFASVPVLLSFIGAVIPSQLGLQEGAQALVAVALGISPTTAVAVVLLQRIRAVVTSGGAWILVTMRRDRGGDDLLAGAGTLDSSLPSRPA